MMISRRFYLIGFQLSFIVGLSACASKNSSDLSRVHFDSDKSSITLEGERILSDNGKYINKTDGKILIEGHTDERGTSEYNIALGERRAKAVADYLAAKGVAKSRLETKSWGEEKALAEGHNEKAYSKNRRAEFVKLEKHKEDAVATRGEVDSATKK